MAAAGEELVHGVLADHPTAADDDEAVGGELHLRQQVGGDEDGTALGRQRADGVTHPADALRVEAVDGFVEDEVLRIAEQGAGEAEALLHAERVAAHFLGRRLGEPDDREALLDPAVGNAGAAGEDAQVGPSAAGGAEPAGVEQGAGDGGLVGQGGEVAAVDGDGAGAGSVEAEDAAHRGGFAGAVGAEEAGDGGIGDGEGEVGDGFFPAVPLVQVGDGDHGLHGRRRPAGVHRSTG